MPEHAGGGYSLIRAPSTCIGRTRRKHVLWEELSPAQGLIEDRWIAFWRLISLHLKCDVFQFAPAFNLEDDRITRSEMANQDLEL